LKQRLLKISIQQGYEWESDYGPAWRFIGRHMHWTPKLLQLAEKYVRDALVIAPYEPTPPVRFSVSDVLE
jgi:hypothetical protein